MSNKPVRTPARLLAAAIRIFAEKGFQETTIAEICLQAGTNIAAVNYHFRDKESLYLEAWRQAFHNELDAHPADGGVSPDAPPERRLAGRIQSLIARIADEKSYSFAIINKEMAQPSRLLAEILDREIHPQRLEMLALIRECAGPGATEQQIRYCHASIIGQCFHLLKMKHLQKSPSVFFKFEDLKDTEGFAEHVVQFSLAGISAIRAGARKEPPC